MGKGINKFIRNVFLVMFIVTSVSTQGFSMEERVGTSTLAPKIEVKQTERSRFTIGASIVALVRDIKHDMQRWYFNKTNKKEDVPIRKLSYKRSYAHELYDRFKSFKEYIEEALYNPHWGFYSSGKARFDPLTDFGTYPQFLSPYFGKAVAIRAYELWQRMRAEGSLKEGETFSMVECGAGNGILARDVLDHAAMMSAKDIDEWRSFYHVLHYTIGEKADALRITQANTLKEHTDKITIKNVDARDLFTDGGFKKNSIKGMIVSNELIDVFGMYKVRFRSRGRIETAVPIASIAPHELMAVCNAVGLDKAFVQRLQAESERDMRHYGLSPTKKVYLSHEDFILINQRLAGPDKGKVRDRFHDALVFDEIYIPAREVPELGAFIEQFKTLIETEAKDVPKPVTAYLIPGAPIYIEQAATLLAAGQIVTIDYGGTTRYIFDNDEDDDEHIRVYDGPGRKKFNPYLRPGTYDITADIDFEILMAEGMRQGLETLIYEQQAALTRGYVNFDKSKVFDTIMVNTLACYIKGHYSKEERSLEHVTKDIEAILKTGTVADHIDALLSYMVDPNNHIEEINETPSGHDKKIFFRASFRFIIETFIKDYKAWGFKLLIQEKGLAPENAKNIKRRDRDSSVLKSA
jgi:SAM-dependent MidA family methyltransferase